MTESLNSRFFRSFLVGIILIVAVGSKIPTSACQCHHKAKKEAPVSKECPFKKLRQIVSSTLLPEVNISVSLPKTRSVEKTFQLADFFPEKESFAPADARAPPPVRV